MFTLGDMCLHRVTCVYIGCHVFTLGGMCLHWVACVYIGHVFTLSDNDIHVWLHCIACFTSSDRNLWLNRQETQKSAPTTGLSIL